MTDDIKVTFRFDKFKEDSAKFQRILKEMDDYKTSASNEDEKIKQWNDEFRRRLSEAGLIR